MNLKGKIAQLDSYELRTAMLFAWLFAFSLAGFVVTLQIPGWDFAPFALAVFAFMSLVTSGYWFLRAIFPQTTADTAEYVEETADNPQNGLRMLDDKELRYYQHLKFFLEKVMQDRLLSASAWANAHKWPAPAVMDYMRELADAGIVLPPSQGRAAQLLVANLEEAWGKLETDEGFDVRAAIERSRTIKQQGKVLAGGYSPSEY